MKKTKALNNIEENIRVYVSNLGLGKYFFSQVQNTLHLKVKETNTLDLIKIKSICSSKGTIKELNK